MPRVFYIPYGKFEFDSDLLKEDIINNLEDSMIEPKLFNHISWKKTKKFVGKLDTKTGQFEILKQLDHKNNFNPRIYGKISSIKSGSRVSVKLRLPTFAYAFLMFLCAFWLVMGLIDLQEIEDYVWTFGGLVFVYVLTFFGFNLGAAQALDSLSEII